MNTQTYGYKRRTIGVLSGWHEDNRPDRYLISVFHGIQSAARARKCNLLLAWGVGHDMESEAVVPAWPVTSAETDFVPVGPWNTDGLIVFAPLLSSSRSDYLQQIIDDGHPVLFIATGEKGPAVSADNEDGINQAVMHLVEHGHKNIAFIAGNPYDLGDSERRLHAYLSAVKQYGLSSDSRLIAHGYHTSHEGYIAMNRILASGAAFTAVVASDDISAIGAMRALREAGRRIPDDVAVIGFDDQPDAVAELPPLASVHVPLTEIGRRALGLMLDHLQGGTALRSLSVPTWLVPRQSCGCISAAVASAGDSKSLAITIPIGLQKPAELKNRIIQQLALAMLAALPMGAMRLNRVQLSRFCTALVKSFWDSIESKDPADFLHALLECLHEVEQLDGEIHPWQEVISVLRRGMILFSPDGNQSGIQGFAEDLLHQARVAIGESAQRRYYRDRFKKGETDFLLGELNALLNSTVDRRRVMEVLAKHLPRMGISHTRVGLFEAEGDDPIAWSILIQGDPQSETQRFFTRQFPPPGTYPPDQLLDLIILPLVFQDQRLGYIALDAANLEPCVAIARQVAATFESARLHAEVLDLSLTDALTGLQNRRFFDLFLKNEVDRSRRFKHAMAVIMIDVDQFKTYNDSFGHLAGDEALRLVARALLENRRQADVITRIGGEEFAVILPETDINGAVEVGHKMLTSVANLKGVKRLITISIGMAELNASESDPQALMKQADQALYFSKNSGRNKITIFRDR